MSGRIHAGQGIHDYQRSDMNWHFATAAFGTINYRLAAERLGREASALGLFKSVNVIREAEAAKLIPSYWTTHRTQLSSRVPGYGWFGWKPPLIRALLDLIGEGDGLAYLDAGCVLRTDSESILRLDEHLKLAEEVGVLGAKADNPLFVEEIYSSGEFLDNLGLSVEMRKSTQYAGGILFIINSEDGRSLVEEWCDWTQRDNQRYLKYEASRSRIPNADGFVGHTLDQAVLSGLLKMRHADFIDFDDLENIKGRPICAFRHRYGYDYFKTGGLTRAVYQVLGMASRARLFAVRRIRGGYR